MKRVALLLLIGLPVLLYASCSKKGDGNTLGIVPVPNFIVADIEISQGTQNLDNEMPLVANRWTIVRVYVNDKNDKGADHVGARLLGFRTCPGPGCPVNANGPTPLPTLSPWNSGGGQITVNPDGGSRVNLDDSFWFFLPKSWREFPGAIQIIAEVNPDDSVSESLSDDNTKSITATFEAANMLQVRAVPLHLHESWDKDKPEVLYECDEPDFWKVFLNMFRYHPVDRMLVTCPSAPLEPFPHETASLDIQPFEWNMGDKTICSDAFTRLKWLKNNENLSGTWQYAGLINPSLPGLCNGWSGAANGNTVWLKMRSNTDPDPGEGWIIDGGVTLAHELGHSWLPNPDHILCKGNEGPPNGQADTEYPYVYPNCRFSAAAARGWYGLDVYYTLWPADVNQPTVLPNGDPDAMISDPKLFPLMGYLKPRWTDPYTYCELLNGYMISEAFFCDRDTIDTNPGGIITNSKPRAARASALTAGELVMVSGKVDFANGSGNIYQVARIPAGEVFSNVIEEAEQKRVEQAATGATSRFSVQVLDTAGGLLDSVPIISEENNHEVPVAMEGFVELLNFPTGAATISLIDSEAPGTVDSRTASLQPPSVDFSAPIGGETLEVGSLIAWRGADGDGDPLRYTLRYSPDGGSTWHVIALDIPGTEYTLPSIDELPGSTAGMLEIVANDGFNTSSARLSGSVLVPGKAPHVTVRGIESGRTISSTDPILISAIVRDVEDGLITDQDSIVWSSDVDGELGGGDELILDPLRLTPGPHRITITATDSENTTADSFFDITVPVGL